VAVLNPGGLFFSEHCTRDDGQPGNVLTSDPPQQDRTDLCTGRHHKGGTWHWPVAS